MTQVDFILRCRRWLYRFEKRRNPEMYHNRRVAVLFWLDKRIAALGRHSMFDWYGDLSA
jgi:hypothetical protein